MKAYRRPPRPTTKEEKQIRKHIQNDVDAYIDTRRHTVSDKIIGLVCLVLSSEFGFGSRRLSKFLNEINEEAKIYIRNEADDAGDELLYVRLESIGLADLADQIKSDKEEEQEAIRNSIFYIEGEQ